MAKKVEIFVPRGSDREDPNVFVGINGVNYLIPRGKKSEVPKEVAEELERSNIATQQFFETSDSLKSKEDK
jgi:hypothetical protein